MTTKVIFRKFNDGGDIIAIFPEIPATRSLWDCETYQHIGQHGPGCVLHLSEVTKPAKPDEYAELQRELEGQGYDDMRIVQRMTQGDLEARKAALI